MLHNQLWAYLLCKAANPTCWVLRILPKEVQSLTIILILIYNFLLYQAINTAPYTGWKGFYWQAAYSVVNPVSRAEVFLQTTIQNGWDNIRVCNIVHEGNNSALYVSVIAIQ